ncbi:MAG: hypothetical protein K6U04_08565 [Armatimonadetes bacterium]|nr:hypothetical protein [Armatimonadota bacterium]
MPIILFITQEACPGQGKYENEAQRHKEMRIDGQEYFLQETLCLPGTFPCTGFFHKRKNFFKKYLFSLSQSAKIKTGSPGILSPGF